MKRESADRSSLFLIELMIAILFFALASAVCIQVFTKSHIKSLETEQLNMAVSKAQSAAEIFLAEEHPEDSLKDIFKEGQMKKDTFTIYYDENFVPAQQESASCLLAVQIGEAEGFQTAGIDVRSLESGKSIYSLTVKKHIPETYKDSAVQEQ